MDQKILDALKTINEKLGGTNDPNEKWGTLLEEIAENLSPSAGEQLFVKGTGWNAVAQYAGDQTSTASGEAATAVGKGNTSSGDFSFTAGAPNTASGETAVALGSYTVASGKGSFAIGTKSSSGAGTTASNTAAFAAGQSVEASGAASQAFGQKSVASGSMSAAFGNNTSATGRSSFVVGQFNVADDNPVDTSHGSGARKYIFIVGNGTADNDRSNAITVDWDGNLVATGAVTASNIPAPPSADGSYVLKLVISSGVATYSWVADT